MKNKRIKKGFIIGMSAMMLASAVAPVDAQAATWKKNKTGWWWEEDNESYRGQNLFFRVLSLFVL